MAERSDKAKNLIGYEDDGLTEQERLEIMNAKQVIKDTLKPNNLNKSSSEFKKVMNEGEEQKIHMEEELDTDHKKKLPPVKVKRIVNIPMKEEKWNLIDMFHADFKVVRVQKAKANPVLFNV